MSSSHLSRHSFIEPRGRYVSVLYNAEACDLPTATAGSAMTKDETGLCDAFDGDGILLSPVTYDAEVR